MSKVVIDAIEKEIAKKQKQLAKVKREVDIWINGYSYLVEGQISAIEEAKEANKKGDYKKALGILETFQKKRVEIIRILQKDSTELFDEVFRLESEIKELETELYRLRRGNS
ncbi:hypothetical protein JCM12298_11020 [Desulfothermus naphthae]